MRWPNHAWNGGSMLLGNRQEIRSKVTKGIAIQCHKIWNPDAVQRREEQQWVFGCITERFGSFDQHACSFSSRPGIRRGVPFDVREGCDERNLKFDFLAAKPWRSWQRSKLIERARQLLDGFNEGRARKGALSGFAPQSGGFFDQASFSAVTRQDLRLALGDVSEVAFECIADAGM
jgi:hypothetical protein